MPRNFQYDVVQLIEGVRDRPCLWDKTLENYKDRVDRRSAWEEIFTMLEARYDEMTPEEKRFVEEQILTKWTNVRDTFLKTLKTKMGRPKKKYLFYDNLKFLTKIIPLEEASFFGDDDIPVKFLKTEEPIEKEAPRTRKRIKKGRKNDEHSSPKKISIPTKEECDSDAINGVDLVECDDDDSIEPRLMNEDEAFFASLLPTVVRYTVEERLEFRMEVLAVMKRINDHKKKWSD